MSQYSAELPTASLYIARDDDDIVMNFDSGNPYPPPPPNGVRINLHKPLSAIMRLSEKSPEPQLAGPSNSPPGPDYEHMDVMNKIKLSADRSSIFKSAAGSNSFAPSSDGKFKVQTTIRGDSTPPVPVHAPTDSRPSQSPDF